MSRIPFRKNMVYFSCSGTFPVLFFLPGIWIVTPEYVSESVKKGSWLPEEPYELDVVSWTPGASNPVRMWREKVASGTSAGAFDGWSVLLMIDEPDRRGKFKR